MTTVKICMGSACYARGAGLIAQALEERCAECTIDLIGQHCDQLCDHGPVVIINGKRLEYATTDQSMALLDQAS